MDPSSASPLDSGPSIQTDDVASAESENMPLLPPTTTSSSTRRVTIVLPEEEASANGATSPVSDEESPTQQSRSSRSSSKSTTSSSFSKSKSPSASGASQGQPRTPQVTRKPFVPQQGDPQYERLRYYSRLTTAAAFAPKTLYEESGENDGEASDGESDGEEDAAAAGDAAETAQPAPLSSAAGLTILVPHHIVPTELFPKPPLAQRLFGYDTQNIRTVFTIWNTMVGSTLLTIPWGFREAGLGASLIIFFTTALISLYTCFLVIKRSVGSSGFVLPGDREVYADFADVCVKYLGRWSQIVALIASTLILIGASIAYHIFMKSCLASVVDGIFKVNVDATDAPWYWNNIAASCYVLIAVFPLSLFKKLTLLVKVNSFGIIFVLSLIAFVIYKCIYAFIFPESTVVTTAAAVAAEVTATVVQTVSDSANDAPGQLVNHLLWFNSKWPHLLGILSLSFFIHNIITSILNDAMQQQNLANRKPRSRKQIRKQFQIRGKSPHKRNTAIAFIFAGVCYFLPGLLGSIAFRFSPEQKENFLNQFPVTDVLATIARIAVLLQLVSIFPLLLYVIRVQIFGSIFNKPWPGFIVVFILNVVLCGITTSICAFYPHPGTILRYVGAVCGLVYMFFLPILVHLVALRKEGKLRWYHIIVNLLLLCIGLAVVVLQFIEF